MERYFKPWKSSQLQAKAKQRQPWAFLERTNALQETNASPIAKKKQRKTGMVACNNARSRCVTKMQLLTPWIQKIMIQQRRQLAWPAPKADSRDLLRPTHGAIIEVALGCTNAQAASMDTTGIGGILIAAPVAKAVAHAATISPLREVYMPRIEPSLEKIQKDSTQLEHFLSKTLFAYFSIPFWLVC